MNFAFWFFSATAILAAFLCITRRSPVSSALWLITTLFNVAALFVLLDAHFLAAVQVLRIHRTACRFLLVSSRIRECARCSGLRRRGCLARKSLAEIQS